jgi:hypothetical protein
MNEQSPKSRRSGEVEQIMAEVEVDMLKKEWQKSKRKR